VAKIAGAQYKALSESEKSKYSVIKPAGLD
jgi:hypothetical protein